MHTWVNASGATTSWSTATLILDKQPIACHSNFISYSNFNYTHLPCPPYITVNKFHPAALHVSKQLLLYLKKEATEVGRVVSNLVLPLLAQTEKQYGNSHKGKVKVHGHLLTFMITFCMHWGWIWSSLLDEGLFCKRILFSASEASLQAQR